MRGPRSRAAAGATSTSGASRADRYKDARIIFKDFEPSNWTWDPVANAYYWHRFYHHQPDLNFDNPEVRQAMFQVVDYWFGMGVDGMRLDAVPYLVEREGTNCENLPETHAFLKELRAHVDERFQGRMLLAEANQWPEDAASYFGNGDECHAAFHFPLMPRMFIAVQMEDRFPIVDTLAQTPAIPDACQWMLFLRNHDELTLEMVTEEERDYMYRVYARDPRARVNLGIRRRLAPLMGNNRRKIELLNALLLSLPGTPIIYYGDELGMGDNIYLGDRNGVRTPMQWNANRNAGFSNAGPQQLYLPVVVDYEYHYETLNVETQQKNPNSLLGLDEALDRAAAAVAAPWNTGAIELLQPSNPKVLAFLRQAGRGARAGRGEPLPLPPIRGTRSGVAGRASARGAFRAGRVSPDRTRPLFADAGLARLLLVRHPPAGDPALAGRRRRRSRKPARMPPLPVLTVQGNWDEVFEASPAAGWKGSCRLFCAPAAGSAERPERFGRPAFGTWFRCGPPRCSRRSAWSCCGSSTPTGSPRDTWFRWPLAMKSNCERRNRRAPAAMICRLEVEKGGARSTGVLYDAFGEEGLSRLLWETIASPAAIPRPERACSPAGLRGGSTACGCMANEPLKIVDFKGRAEQQHRVLRRPVPPEDLPPAGGGSQSRVGDRDLPDGQRGLFARPAAGRGHRVSRAAARPGDDRRAGGLRPQPRRRLELHLGHRWITTSRTSSRNSRCRNCPPRCCPTSRCCNWPTEPPPSLAESMFGPYLESAALLGRRTAEIAHRLGLGNRSAAFRPRALLAVLPALAVPGHPQPGRAEPSPCSAATWATSPTTSRRKARPSWPAKARSSSGCTASCSGTSTPCGSAATATTTWGRSSIRAAIS